MLEFGPQGDWDSQPSLGSCPAITHIISMINRTAPGELLGIQFMLPKYPIPTSTHFNTANQEVLTNRDCLTSCHSLGSVVYLTTLGKVYYLTLAARTLV